MPFVILPTNSASGGYDITNSLRFNFASSDNLSRTPASSGNRNTWTLSFWIKKDANGVYRHIFNTSDTGNSNTNLGQIYFDNADKIAFFLYTSATAQASITTTQVFRDLSAWYHIVIAYDDTQATASNRVRFYVNGSEITSFSVSTYPSQNLSGYFNMNQPTFFGKDAQSGGTNYLSGYLSETYFIDGQQLTPSSFGETDEDTGIWKPKAFSGTYGTNGFYLQFKNSASLGTDSSGNGNTFTVNNLTSIDQTTDTPTNNFATWNPLNAYNSTTVGTLSEGNLKISGTATDGGVPSTIGMSKGKWYFEVACTTTTSGEPVFGVINSAGASKMQNANSGSVTSGSGVWCMISLTSGGYGFQENGVLGSYPSSTLANGDILNIALDVDAQKIWYGKNGTWYNSGNPATGANAISTNLTANETWFFYNEKRATATVTSSNFGNPPYTANGYTDSAGFGNFSYQPPANYFSLCTKNLATYG